MEIRHLTLGAISQIFWTNDDETWFSILFFNHLQDIQFFCYNDWNTCFTYNEIPNLNNTTTPQSWGENPCKYKSLKNAHKFIFSWNPTYLFCFKVKQFIKLMKCYQKKREINANLVVGEENWRVGCFLTVRHFKIAYNDTKCL